MGLQGEVQIAWISGRLWWISGIVALSALTGGDTHKKTRRLPGFFIEGGLRQQVAHRVALFS
jgi:hypothetical protein